MNEVIGWLATIVSTLIVCAGQLALNERFKRADEKRDRDRETTNEKRKAEVEWREGVDSRLEEQDAKIAAVLSAQCTQMRSDVTHKVHRYMDDLHCASTEEKQSLYAEYEVYCEICSKFGIENHFVEQLIKQVMELPDRTPK